MITIEQAEPFFRYARYRELRRLSKEHEEIPNYLLPEAVKASKDPVLERYRFCNVFREDDRTTRYIRQHVTPERYGDRFLGALVVSRWFNRIETIERLQEVDSGGNDLLGSWQVIDELTNWVQRVRGRLHRVQPLVTGAYMIKTPAGLDKLDGLLWCFQQILPDCQHLQLRMDEDTTLEGVHEVLAGYPYLGSFMAYELVTDLRWTLLQHAEDINTWAAAGPVAARGVCRLLGVPLGTYKYQQRKDQQILLGEMRCLLQYSRNGLYWPSEWRPWEMREVEHLACEFDKYERARLGEGTPKQIYRKA